MNTNWLKSSTGSGNLALTVKGVLVALIPFIIWLGQRKGLTITENDVMNWVEVVGTFVSAAMVLAGLARKIYYWIKR